MRGERGSATPFAVATLGLVLFIGAALGVVTAMVASHRSAQAAADLASLAGAASLQRHADPCAAAVRVAEANGATVEDCSIRGADVSITVRVIGPHWLGQAADLRAQARAGPAP
jgi:secretion/DNA translocation related TadE-like protein